MTEPNAPTTTTDPATAGADPDAAGALEDQRKRAEEAVAGEVESAGDDAFGDVELEDDGMPSTDDLMQAMKAVVDPEIGYNVVDLGLVYDIEKVEDGGVLVTMTLTSMGCPLTELIHQQVTLVMTAMPGVEHADVNFTFTPPWGPEMISDYVRDELRAMGMNV
ncbi:MAG TPA: metal-sulfur cluster assembly factor [Nitriliruptorales bacterium]